MKMFKPFIFSLLSCVLFSFLFSVQVVAQEGLKIEISPNPIELEVGDSLQVEAKVVNAAGEQVTGVVVFFSRNRRALAVSQSGVVKALKPGSYQLIALKPGQGDDRIMQEFEVNVPFPAVAGVTVTNKPPLMYLNATHTLKTEVVDVKGFIRENPGINYSSSDENVVEVSFGKLLATGTGSATITAEFEGKRDVFEVEVKENPVASLTIGNTDTQVRTGDVIHFDVEAADETGSPVDGVPVKYSFIAEPDDNRGQGASAQVAQDGRFVANHPGLYTLIAKSGNTIAQQVIRVEPRNVRKNIEIVGRGEVLDVHTSDLWIWEGVDGRDYAITGTWGANGDAYFWDVTDPSDIIAIDTIRVDARTVNDVKVSEDGRLAVISREGASDRKNGLVILDVTNPREVSIISEYEEGLTGGVHNVFIYEDHVYAINNGRRYDIINIEDPANPYTVSRFELDTPGHAVHDVWIEDGIAYSSNWSDGVVAVDVGRKSDADVPDTPGLERGSPENPVKLGSYKYPSGWNHAAFPFKSQSTGDFYVIAGDEAFPFGLPTRENPVGARGWIHFFKLNGWDNAKEVARYQVPEAGTHNMWVRGDTLYVAYYNAGLRIVDISGELMGNLYDQGREIAVFEPNDPDALVPNAPFTWGPQPYKGHIFISDWNSGLWAVKLTEPVRGTN